MPQLSEEQQALQERMKNMSPEELRELQQKQCIFCQIISGKIPSKKVYEDAQSIAIMDINPAAPGHILLLPKEHYGLMPQVPDELLGSLFVIAKRLSQVMLKVLRVSGTNIFVANGLAAGQKAPHVIIHIIPRREGDGLFSLQPQIVDSALLRQIAVSVEQKFNALMGIKKEVVNAGDKISSVPEETSAPEEELDLTEESAVEEQLVPTTKNKPKTISKKSVKEEKNAPKPTQNSAKENQKTIKERKTEEVSLDDIASLFK